VNVDGSPQVASRLGVQGIPTLVLLHKGRPAARQVGAAPEAALESWLDAALAESATS
jgi:thioredoxin-like negative regulator of GroEL